jgi:hypothetical protein
MMQNEVKCCLCALVRDLMLRNPMGDLTLRPKRSKNICRALYTPSIGSERL